MSDRPRVTMKKYMGDDSQSWAVFVDGQPKWTGMNHSEAKWRKQKEELRLAEEANK